MTPGLASLIDCSNKNFKEVDFLIYLAIIDVIFDYTIKTSITIPIRIFINYIIWYPKTLIIQFVAIPLYFFNWLWFFSKLMVFSVMLKYLII